AVGAVASPFDSFLTLRGAKNLALRMERHCDNALAIARWLEGRKDVGQGHPQPPGLGLHAGRADQHRSGRAAPLSARQGLGARQHDPLRRKADTLTGQ
ncbi:PLP-dependent transferase, partial [Shewanella sp. A25]|nr:PLP-dependent transferase [Shewanella shenzhenensis]